MKHVKPWANALQVAPEKYSAWTIEAPKHESLTFYCLDRGLIRSNEYFNWAKEYYGLPMIDTKYFQQPANRELWQQIQSVAHWTPALLPLEMWDGVVFVACVEPPDDVQWSFPVQYVLAHPRDLKLYLERLDDDPTRIGRSILTSPSFHTSSQVLTPPVVQETTPPSLEAPVGVSLSLPDLPSTNEGLDEVTSPSMVLPPIDVPEGLNISSEILKSETPTLDQPKLEIPEGLGDVLGLASASASASASAPPPLTSKSPPPPSVQAQVLAKPNSKGGPQGYEIDSDQLASSSIDAATSSDEALAWVFLQMKQHFIFSWMLFYHDGNLSPWRWDKGAQPRKDSALSPLDLSPPSLFRIVVRSKMPYHGHVIDNPVNSEFFKNWGLRSIPEHVTAIPLMSGEHLIGILLGAGAKTANTDQVLQFMERMGSAAVRSLSIKQAA